MISSLESGLWDTQERFLSINASRDVGKGGNPLIMEIFIIDRPVAQVVKVASGGFSWK